MQWYGKAIGATLGLIVAGPIGSILGALLGHQFDEGTGAGRGGASKLTQSAFFEITFEVMGHLAKVDGRVSEEEVRVARRIMHARCPMTSNATSKNKLWVSLDAPPRPAPAPSSN